MKIEYLKRDSINCDNRVLVVLFAGWSCDAEQFRSLRFTDSDLCVVYDYTTLDFPTLDTSSYNKVIVLAWSFGVWVASYAVSMGLLTNDSFKIALNGTTLPIDDLYGIPSRSFELTLRSLGSGGMDKFNRRLYGSLYGLLPLSAREFALQLDELKLLSAHFKCVDVISPPVWDLAIIGTKDIIFPVDNMVRFWNKNSTFTAILEDTPHYPFTQECILELNRVISTL